MSFMEQFTQKMNELGIKAAAVGENWFSSPVGVFTQPESDRVLYAPNSLLDSPGLVAWVALTAVQVAREIDPTVVVYSAEECYPVKLDYTEYEMDPTLVKENTVKIKNMRILNTAQNLLKKSRSEASQLLGGLMGGQQAVAEAPKLILPDQKVITDV